MMIKDSLKLASSRIFTARTMPALATRSFTGNTKVLDEKEKGDERIYFKRQEGKKL